MENLRKLENYSDVLTLNEVAEYFNVSKDSIKKLVSLNLLKSFKIGRMYRFRKEDIEDFLRKN